MCTNCGGNNAACCPGDNCQAGFSCVPGMGGAAGTCRTCGGPNQPCCQGQMACRAGNRCIDDGPGDGTCRPCGGRGEVCCANSMCEGNLTCRLPNNTDGGQAARRCEPAP
jgi:hypothetical protein